MKSLDTLLFECAQRETRLRNQIGGLRVELEAAQAQITKMQEALGEVYLIADEEWLEKYGNLVED